MSGLTGSAAAADKPMRDLLRLLPKLSIDSQGEPDFLNSPPSLLVDLASSADTGAKALSLGVAAIGNLIAYSAPEIEDGTISSDTVEALGWLLSELGEVAAACFVLAAKCRRARAGTAEARQHRPCGVGPT